MNIKSELNKPIFWFKNLSINLILLASILAIIISIIIIFGDGGGANLGMKIVFLVISFMFLGLSLDGLTTKDQEKLFSKTIVTVFLTILIVEIGLYQQSKITEHIPVFINVREEIKTSDKDKTEKYLKVFIINENTNDVMDYEKLRLDEQDKLNNLKQISSKETYYNYIPFVLFEKKFKYHRTEEN